jgi:hypothetical protein
VRDVHKYISNWLGDPRIHLDLTSQSSELGKSRRWGPMLYGPACHLVLSLQIMWRCYTLLG